MCPVPRCGNDTLSGSVFLGAPSPVLPPDFSVFALRPPLRLVAVCITTLTVSVFPHRRVPEKPGADVPTLSRGSAGASILVFQEDLLAQLTGPVCPAPRKPSLPGHACWCLFPAVIFQVTFQRPDSPGVFREVQMCHPNPSPPRAGPYLCAKLPQLNSAWNRLRNPGCQAGGEDSEIAVGVVRVGCSGWRDGWGRCPQIPTGGVR